jgi:hypothetical protein
MRYGAGRGQPPRCIVHGVRSGRRRRARTAGRPATGWSMHSSPTAPERRMPVRRWRTCPLAGMCGRDPCRGSGGRQGIRCSFWGAGRPSIANCSWSCPVGAVLRGGGVRDGPAPGACPACYPAGMDAAGLPGTRPQQVGCGGGGPSVAAVLLRPLRKVERTWEWISTRRSPDSPCRWRRWPLTPCAADTKSAATGPSAPAGPTAPGRVAPAGASAALRAPRRRQSAVITCLTRV